MIKQLLTLLLLLALPYSIYAQQIDRIMVSGTISAPVGDNVEAVSVYNISSQKGSITDENGDFEIEVARNDRVQISALQFQSFTIVVDEGIINTKTMNIYLNPAVNQLEEVIVRPYDLTGNIVADVNRIKTSDIDSEFDLGYEAMEFNYGFIVDSQSSIRGNYAENAFHNGQQQWGLDFVGLAGLFFGSKKKSDVRAQSTSGVVSNALWQRFSIPYVTQTFNIPPEYVSDFLYFAQENGLTTEMLKPQNEFRLLEFLFIQSELYKKQIER